MRHNRIKSLALLVLFVLCAALGAVPAFAAGESVTVEIPVYAVEVDCHAVLKDESGTVVKTVAVPAGGSAKISFDCEGLGAHKYTLSLSDVDVLPYEFDKRVYNIEVQLFYNDAGEIFHTVEASNPNVVIIDGVEKVGKLEFINAAGYIPCKIDPPVRKVVKGSPPVNSTFTFEFKADNASNPMPPGSSGGVKQMNIIGPGVKDFGDIEFTEPGTYWYTVRELAGDAAGYTYDTTIYRLRIVVIAGPDRLLASSYKYLVNNREVDMAEATFTNTYDPKGKGPKTGDESNAGLWLAIAGVSLAAILVLLFFLKRRRKDEQPPEADTRPKD